MDFNELIIRFCQTIYRRRRLFLFVFLVCFTAATIGAYVKPQRFQSSTTIFVSFGSPRLDTSRSEQRNNVAILQSEEFVASQVELMQTRDLIEELVDTVPPWVFESKPSSKWYIRAIVDSVSFVSRYTNKFLVALKLVEPTNPRYENILTIENNLEIFPVRKSQVVEVSFVSKNPEVPKVILDTFIEIYKTRLSDLRSKSEGANIYMAQAEKLNKELAKAEKALTDFMVENGIVDIDLEKTQILERLDAIASLAELSEETKDSSNNMKFAFIGENAPPQIKQQTTNLNKLLIERIKLAASFTSNQRDVLRLDKQIAGIRSILNDELKILANVKEQDRKNLERLFKLEPRYNWLSRQVNVLSTSYETYSKAAKDRETFFERDNQILAQIIDPPVTPYQPMKPSRLILVAIGLVLSVILSLVFVLLTDWIAQIRELYSPRWFKMTDNTEVSLDLRLMRRAADSPNEILRERK
jgi:polysaccharide biosynthesis transport protein